MQKILLELNFRELDILIFEHIKLKFNQILNNLYNINDIENGLKIDIFVTPKRLIFLLEMEDKITFLNKGVKIDDRQNLDFFLKKNNLKSEEELIVLNDRYYCKKIVEGVEFSNKITGDLNKILNSLFLSLKIHRNISNKLILNLTNILTIKNNN